jgi:probable HAF family extracellular repeat protein
MLVACNQNSNQRYTLTLLDSLGGDRSWAYAINNLGQVVGASRAPDGFTSHAVVWNGAALTDLGAAAGNNSVAYDINEAGQIVGQQGTAAGWSAISWFHDGAAYLENQPGGVSTANGINNAGQIVGESEPDVNSRAYASVWKNGKLSTMGTLGGGGLGIALKINDAGDIVGYSANARGEERPTLWKNGSPVDLGTLGGSGGAAGAINQQGQIVGSSATPYGAGFTTHATLWQRGTITDLGTLGGSYSRAGAINNSGQIVGLSTGPDERPHPVIWRSATASPVDIGTLVDASAAGLQIEEPAAINDHGQIVATAQMQDGSVRVVVLTPAGCQ